MIAWVYGSGFPKSMDITKAIDKSHSENKARQLRFTAWMRSTGITAKQIKDATGTDMASHYLTDKSQPAIATADLFDKLRPYLPEVPEEIERLVAERTGIEWSAYKNRPTVGKMIGNDTSKARPACSLSSQGIDKSTKREYEITAPATDAAKQWHGWGTSLKPALEPITMARKPLEGTVAANVLAHGCGGLNVDACRVEGKPRGTHGDRTFSGRKEPKNGWGMRLKEAEIPTGRFPANLIHDGSDEVLELFPETSSNSGNLTHSNRNRPNEIYGRYGAGPTTGITDAGSAARFFYCAKASRSERGKDNTHPTVKPIDLMRYLIRLVNPPGGIVLDPFAGSGTTLLAARLEGAQSIGVELDEKHCEIIARRLDKGLPF
jgi:site-specific DNA-methyltransferase (adenine-specific)